MKNLLGENPGPARISQFRFWGSPQNLGTIKCRSMRDRDRQRDRQRDRDRDRETDRDREITVETETERQRGREERGAGIGPHSSPGHVNTVPSLPRQEDHRRCTKHQKNVHQYRRKEDICFFTHLRKGPSNTHQRASYFSAWK